MLLLYVLYLHLNSDICVWCDTGVKLPLFHAFFIQLSQHNLLIKFIFLNVLEHHRCYKFNVCICVLYFQTLYYKPPFYITLYTYITLTSDSLLFKGALTILDPLNFYALESNDSQQKVGFLLGLEFLFGIDLKDQFREH